MCEGTESSVGGQREDEKEQGKGLCQVGRKERAGGQVCDRWQGLVSWQMLLVRVQAVWVGSIWLQKLQKLHFLHTLNCNTAIILYVMLSSQRYGMYRACSLISS